MFNKIWKNVLFVVAFGAFGGLIALVIVSVAAKKVKGSGNWADWVSGIGTIAAIVASIFITRYQLKHDRELSRQSFFIEQEFIMLQDVVNDIANIDSAFHSVLQTDKGISYYVEKDFDRAGVEKSLTLISNRLTEYGSIQFDYAELVGLSVHPLLESYESFMVQVYDEEVSESLMKASVEDVMGKYSRLQDKIIDKKNKIRKSD